MSDKKQEYIAIGRIGAPWGLKGEAKFQFYNPESEVLKKTRLIYFKAGLSFEGLASPPPPAKPSEPPPQRLSPDGINTFTAYKICTFRKQGAFFVISFEGYSSPEEVKKLQGEEVFVTCATLPPKKKNEYFVHELIGMSVQDEEGMELGEVVALENYGSSDILNVRKQESDSSKDYMIPWIPDVIVSVDDKSRRIIIRKLEGLL